MKLNRLAIALAAFSIAGGAIAAGTDATTTTAPPSASQATTSGASSMGSAAGSASAAEETNPALVRSVQQALKQKGYDAGSIDGHVGPSTEKALRDFQQAQGLPQSGSLDAQTLSALGVDQSPGAMQAPGNPGTSSMQGQDRMPSTSSTNGATAPSAYK